MSRRRAAVFGIIGGMKTRLHLVVIALVAALLSTQHGYCQLIKPGAPRPSDPVAELRRLKPEEREQKLAEVIYERELQKAEWEKKNGREYKPKSLEEIKAEFQEQDRVEKERVAKARERTLSSTNAPLSNITHDLDWRRGESTNDVTVSFLTGVVPSSSGIASFLGRDMTFDADGRLKSISPVRYVFSGRSGKDFIGAYMATNCAPARLPAPAPGR